VVAFAAVDDLPKGVPLVLIEADPTHPSEAADALRAPKLEPAVRAAFAARYEQRFGEAPSRYAFEGYRAAGLIDRAIRIVGADLSNQQNLRAAFEAAARQP
jgi:hypothetical protein